MMKIGIMGAPADNPNHGCMALLYSLLHILCEIETESREEFQFTIFDWKYSEKHMKMLSGLLGIREDKLAFAPFVMLTDPVRFVYHLPQFIKMRRAIRECDVVIDLTEGDGFSDIYGDFLFFGRTNVKKYVEKLGIPLILGPQTYGPYSTAESEKAAAEVIRNAKLVMTRDVQSCDYLKEKMETEAGLSSDLAFFLPVGEWQCPETDKIKVGINASNLLFGTTEMKDRKFEISVDYRKYLEKLAETLLESGKYEIFLISHVDDDYAVNSLLHEKYPKLQLVPRFTNPTEAKACISSMDVFVGARMHGTIAAFTTGVACIPTAYSAKFEGLFAEYDYRYLVNLCELTTEEAVDRTLLYINDAAALSKAVADCEEKRQEMAQRCKSLLKTGLSIS